MVSSAAPHCSKLYVAYNGRSRKPPRWMLNAGLPTVYEKFAWEDDFSLARNQSFAMVPRDKHEWLLWLDHDDELYAPSGLDLAEHPETTFMMFRYDYGTDETGTVVSVQWRERMFSTRQRMKWVYPIHEVCWNTPGAQAERPTGAWVKHYRDPDLKGPRRDRNRRIVAKAMRDYPDVVRFRYFFALEIFAEALEEPDAAKRTALFIRAAEQFKMVVTESQPDDSYRSNHTMADCFRSIGDHARAIDTDLQGVKLLPTWPDSYNGIALSCAELLDWSRSEQWASMCLACTTMPVTQQVIEPMEARYTPLALRAQARANLGRYDEALQDIDQALAIRKSPELMAERDRVELARDAERSRPVVERKPMELLYARRRSRPQGERSIAFFNKPLFEPWHPELEVVHGVGGTEKCVMRLAEQFALDGWRVEVYGTPGPCKGVDELGIEWWDSEDFLSMERHDVVVSSRTPELFDAEVNAGLRVLWLHDVNVRDALMPGSGLFGDRLSNIDEIVCLTRWHAHHTESLYGLSAGRCQSLPNGMDLHLFPRAVPTQGARMAWLSSPDRGVDVLLEMWPDVRKRWPQATLDVFYGWEAIDKIVAMDSGSGYAQRLLAFKHYVEELVESVGGEEGGVRWRGRVPQAQVAAALYDVDVWAYPTYFMETYCMSALDAQAAGVFPVTSRLAGLCETVACDDLLVDGWPNNETYRKLWLKKLEHVVEMGDRERSKRAVLGRGLAEARSWAAVYGNYWKPMCERRFVSTSAQVHMARA